MPVQIKVLLVYHIFIIDATFLKIKLAEVVKRQGKGEEKGKIRASVRRKREGQGKGEEENRKTGKV